MRSFILQPICIIVKFQQCQIYLSFVYSNVFCLGGVVFDYVVLFAVSCYVNLDLETKVLIPFFSKMVFPLEMKDFRCSV